MECEICFGTGESSYGSELGETHSCGRCRETLYVGGRCNGKTLHLEAIKRIKEITVAMNGLSDEGFAKRYRNDPYFRAGFDVLVDLFKQTKFNN